MPLSVDWPLLLGGSLLLAILWMTIAYGVYWRTQNASWVDAFWGSGIGVQAIYWVSWGPLATQHLILPILVLLWSLRISVHLFQRIATTPEDARYSVFRTSWGNAFSLKLFGLYQMQAGLVVLMSTPVAITMISGTNSFDNWQLTGIFVFAIGFLIESIADAQLSQFKAQRSQSNTLCNVGLWKYSRHPNYFGEILIWIGLALQTQGIPFGYLSWIAPALIAYFLIFVTGIPLTEAQALRSKGNAYRLYQQKTSVLIPWFQKKVEI